MDSQKNSHTLPKSASISLLCILFLTVILNVPQALGRTPTADNWFEEALPTHSLHRDGASPVAVSASADASGILFLPLVLHLSPAPGRTSTPGSFFTGEWFRGDLHAHSLYSDGDSPVAEVIASAEAAGLDFFALTDHDGNLRGMPTHWDDPDYHSEQMVLLYGVEWTTIWGHANVWASAPFAYDALWAAHLARDPAAAVTAAHAQGALFSINHPNSLCCGWRYPVVEGIDAVETWNSLYRFPSFNRWATHRFWDDLLEDGRRVPCVGGSDTHQLEGFEARLYGHGNPTTWVLTEARTAEAILAGIKAGRTTISYAPDAPRLEFTADADGDGEYEAIVGNNISASDREITFKVQVVEPASQQHEEMGHVMELEAEVVSQLRDGSLSPLTVIRSRDFGARVYLAGVFKNGRLFRVWLFYGGADSFTFCDTPTAGTFYRVELLGNPDVHGLRKLLYGKVIAMTSPIYVDFPE